MKTVQISSPAKVNLFLEVIGKRSDGYHELETVFQEIDICDEIEIRRLENRKIEITTDSPDIPADSTNLTYRASALFLKQAGLEQGVHIHLKKKIPVAAGLGGGSGNAAATLVALEKLFGIELPMNTRFELARRLGADVPFFLKGGTAIGRGIGDLIEPLRIEKKFPLVLVNPRFKIPTPDVYRQLNLNLIRQKADISPHVSALKSGNIRQMSTFLFNRLEDVVLQKFPQLNEIKNLLIHSGALGALLSGSGPTLYAIAESEKDALRIQEKADKYALKCWTAVCHAV